MLALVLVSCSAVVFGGGDDEKEPSTSFTSPTVSVSDSATPTMAAIDESARTMCAQSALAAAHHKVGNYDEESDAQSEAAMDALGSSVPEVQRLAFGPADTRSARIQAWCRANVRVKTPKVKKAAPTPDPYPTDDPSDSDGGGVSDVRPGAFCSPGGATGTWRGRVYTCKGPGQNRWRR
ncbi:hypothetical protein [Actinomadura macrotermitis]|uniref:hypothetical protein n=1 Tax=Actinomadura macrotermitis TaxID=2585200 RepID=UPI0012957A14|nr:hypothetical protein [Actinomadura macrotermitis]